jgi:3-ketosteroid 9alpha-monooxygenase subunit A
LSIGKKQLMALRTADANVSVYDAVCPHRGANLAWGGVLHGSHVVCPFHGKSVGLGTENAGPYCVSAYPSFSVGSGLFVCLDSARANDYGFEATMLGFAATRVFYPGGTQHIVVPQQLVTENAFDLDHFRTVHRITSVLDRAFGRTPTGAVYSKADFLVRPPVWERSEKAAIRSRFYATAFSPSLVLTELGPPGASHVVLTGATADGQGAKVRTSMGSCPRRAPMLPPPKWSLR